MVEEVDFVEDMDSDDLWLKSHLEDIVDRYAHKVIAILDQQIVGVGTSIAELQQTVAAHYPQRVPLIFEGIFSIRWGVARMCSKRHQG